MVSLEFEKPNTWSIGKKLGILAIILLILGPFLPYAVSESRIGDDTITNDISYFNFEFTGLWMLLPLFSALFIIVLLYIKFEIYLEHEGKSRNIKHFILMIWGLGFFLAYLADAIRLFHDFDTEWSSHSQYAGLGLWMIVGGFFLCALIGFLEWRYPSVAGPKVPKVALPRRKEPKVAAEVSSEPAPTTVVAVEPERAPSKTMVRAEPPKVEPSVERKPIPVTSSTEPQVVEKIAAREPTSEEEKALLRWARHINRDGQTFEQCMKCQNYVFINAKDTGASIVFECPDCGESFILKNKTLRSA